ncbi:MAG: hypothetical protein A2Y92_05780 [Chloroflexi bacterium RBG_13_57_8]|nr:MAG: hypothetical protein A2Y92_05780 [Chloroflexi bacterium RBG_13_57_8]
MQSSLIGKIEKAKRYAQEKDRVTFSELEVKFRGENSDYHTGYKDGKWHCTCSFFPKWGVCSHTMALEKILAGMLPPEAVTTLYEDAGNL